MVAESKLINFKNVSSNLLNKKIYRYVSFETLLSLIENRSNRLSKVTSWKTFDPYENVLFEVPIKSNNDIIHLSELSRHYYAQCWSLEKESDVMWQLYRSRYINKGGAVKIESTIGDLLNSCSSEDFKFIGKVDYLKISGLKKYSKKLRESFEDVLMSDGGTGKAIARQLLIKRFAYRFEREIRLLVPKFKFKNENNFPENFDYKVDPKTFIKKVVFDPLMDIPDFRLKKNMILKVSKLSVIRSNLYKFDVSQFQ